MTNKELRKIVDEYFNEREYEFWESFDGEDFDVSYRPKGFKGEHVYINIFIDYHMLKNEDWEGLCASASQGNFIRQLNGDEQFQDNLVDNLTDYIEKRYNNEQNDN